jgi:NADPH:quinone reductase-like Zn-dependent oxidoreductase
MLALTSASERPHAQLTEVPEPEPLPHQALVDVKAISLNRGETRRLATLDPGTITGWDLAGVVRAAAADGSGPRQGARVVGMMNAGAWAQRAPVNSDWLAELPDGISFEQAATLPVAGLTALRAIERGGFVLGKRVLVTGASGGVGRFAIQLAKLGGAHVTAIARRHAGLERLGADITATEIDLDGPLYDLVIDAVGGPVLGAALRRVKSRGLVVNFASTTDEPVTYPTRELFGRAPGASLYGLYIFEEVQRTGTCSADLRRLAECVADGRLDPQVALTAPWREAGSAIEALLDRRVDGKAVLTVD